MFGRFLDLLSYVSSNPSSIEFSSEKRPSDDIVPNDSKIRVLVRDSRTQAISAIQLMDILTT